MFAAALTIASLLPCQERPAFIVGGEPWYYLGRAPNGQPYYGPMIWRPRQAAQAQAPAPVYYARPRPSEWSSVEWELQQLRRAIEWSDMQRRQDDLIRDNNRRIGIR